MQTLTYGHLPPVWPWTLNGVVAPKPGGFCCSKAGFGPVELSKRLEQAAAASAGGSAPQGGEEWQSPPSPPEAFVLSWLFFWSWLSFGPLLTGWVGEEEAMQRRRWDPPHPPHRAVPWEAAAGVGSPVASLGFCFSLLLPSPFAT